jgi:tetratricopeptide (TPR) repeat protein
MDTQRFEHAITLRDAGRLDEAIRELTLLAQATTDPQEKASLVLNESTCLAIMGRFDEARDRLREAIRISPTTEVRARADFTEAVLSRQEGRRAEALTKLDNLLKDYSQLLCTPDHRDLYYEIQRRRGSLLAGVARFREARVVLEECSSFPLDARDEQYVLYNLGACYVNMGENERGKQTLLEALEKGLQGSDAVSSHYYLGTIYSAEKAYAKALMEFEWCLAHVEEGQIPKKHICEWLASTARTLGMKEEAERYDELAND